MTVTYTRRAIDVFAPDDANSNPRSPDNGEVQTWGVEVETNIDSIDASTTASIASIQSTVDNLTDNLSQGDAYQAWWNVKDKLSRGTQDIKIMMTGDSTSNETTEVGYKIASEVFAAYPAYTVNYYLFDFNAGGWVGPTVAQTGTGSQAVNFYNASTNGATLDEVTGQYQSTIGTGFDLIIINQGHNYNSNTSSGAIGFNGTDAYRRLDESIEDIVRIWSDVPIVVSLQNPSQTLGAQDQRCHRAFERIANERMGVSLVDTRRVFLEANKPSSWYKDDLHPSETGSENQTAEHLRCFTTSFGRYPNPPRPREVCLNSTYFDAKNLLLNGRFTSFTSGVAAPDNWTSSGTGTVSDEETDVPSFLTTHAVKLQDDVHIQQAVSDTVLDRIKGRTVVVAALLKISGGSATDDAGSLRINGGVGGMAYNGSIGTSGVKYAWPRHYYPYANGAYAWRFLEEDIPYSATSGSVGVLLYGGNGAVTNGRYALWACAGLFLRDEFDKWTTWF